MKNEKIIEQQLNKLIGIINFTRISYDDFKNAYIFFSVLKDKELDQERLNQYAFCLVNAEVVCITKEDDEFVRTIKENLCIFLSESERNNKTRA